MTHDRDYWRSSDERRLIEEARDSGHELAIALGERLAEFVDLAETLEDEIKEAAEDARLEFNKTDDRIYELESKIERLELMLGTRDDRIEELEAQLKEHKA